MSLRAPRPAKLHENRATSDKSDLLTLTPLISARFYLRPGFFDPVADKGLSVVVSGLESTVVGGA